MNTPEHNSPWIRRFHPSPEARIRLVCLPHAGGGATYYHPLSAALAPDVEALAVQYPGHQDRHREPCIDSLPELARRLVPELLPLTDRPFAVFGHSMGASLGFEVARLLEHEHGVVPAALFASGRRAPSEHREEFLHQQGDDVLVRDVRELSGTDARLLADPELLDMVLPALRSDYKAIETYRYVPGPDLSCPVTVLIGDEDPRVTLDEARSWTAHTTGDFALKVYGGGHFYLTRHTDAVAREISGRLLSTTGASRS
ncbi:thioesterase II family protein [Streptomyces sp. NPDC127190]|uniref:thioesterase II family protein n=1 Tax=unclassified Streptomyces TaxID=2593676 RepID=UPI00363E441A